MKAKIAAVMPVYNEEDVINLKTLADKLTARIKEDTFIKYCH